jgi:hypothetical protein
MGAAPEHDRRVIGFQRDAFSSFSSSPHRQTFSRRPLSHRTSGTGFHKRTIESLQAAFGIIMTGDIEAARKLLRTKTDLRNLMRRIGILNACAKVVQRV